MKPVASGSVLVRLPVAAMDADFAASFDDFDERTAVERVGEGHYRVVTRAAMGGRVIQEFQLERADVDETAVHATIWLQPAYLGFLVRLLGRRRLQRGVDAALRGMAQSATGEPEFGPEDFLDEEPPPEGAGHAPEDSAYRSDAPRDQGSPP
jgi:hypothetical protein